MDKDSIKNILDLLNIKKDVNLRTLVEVVIPKIGEMLELEKDFTTTTTTGDAPTLTEVYVYFREMYDGDALKEANKFHAYNENKGWTCLPNWQATADLWIARIEDKE